jgi:hypothetical protein
MNQAQIYGFPLAIIVAIGQILTNSAFPARRYAVTSPTAENALSTEIHTSAGH